MRTHSEPVIAAHWPRRQPGRGQCLHDLLGHAAGGNHYGEDAHIGKKASGQLKVSSRPARETLSPASRRFN
jgi:hypothetical protein